MRKARRIFAIALCALMLVSTLAVGAANQWVFRGHRIDNDAIRTGIYPKQWYEVDANGVPTGNFKEDGRANNVEWRHVWYEKDYPHAEIVALYLEGNYAGIIRESGAVANWPVEYVPEMWELKYPYRILERLTTTMPDGTKYANTLEHRGITKDVLLAFLGKNEKVTMSYEYFGFGPFRIVDRATIENSNYRPVTIHCTTWNCDHKECNVSPALANNYYTWRGATTQNGNYIVYAGDMLAAAGVNGYNWPAALNDDITAYGYTDAQIRAMIPVFTSQYLMGPDYATNSMQKIDIASHFGLSQVASYYDPHFIMPGAGDMVAQIAWSETKFEAEWPYAEYETLVVNGVELDGSFVGFDLAGNRVKLPNVYRYTGGFRVPEYNPNNIHNVKNGDWR